MSPEDREKSMQEVVDALKVGSIDTAKKLIRDRRLSPEDKASTVKTAVMEMLKKSDAYNSKEAIEAFNLSEEVLTSPEVVAAVREGIMYALTFKPNRASAAEAIAKSFGYTPEMLASEEMHDAAQAAVIDSLERGSVSSALMAMKAFGVSEEYFHDPKAQAAGTLGLAYLREKKLDHLVGRLQTALGLKEYDA